MPDPRSHLDVPDLATIPLFAGVPERLLALVTPEMVRFYPDEDIIFRQGDQADSLLVVLHGQVKISADGTYLVTRMPYALIGEQAFIHARPRSASAVAQGMVMALALPQALVERLLENPMFRRNLLQYVSEKLAESTNERAFRYRNERLLFSEFRAHVSPTVAQRLLATGLAYGDPRYVDAIILFSDIRGFTQQSSHMAPQDIAEQLSHYFDAVVDVIHRHGGLVDKFVGDAVMALWGVTPSDADLAAQALACACEMVATATQMRFGDAPINIGVGINAGRVFSGNVGGNGKRQYTVLGTPVNLAARYESASKEHQAPIVAGEAFLERLRPDVRAQFVAHSNQEVKGAENQTLFTFDPTDDAITKQV